jgi:hypothetical protein
VSRQGEVRTIAGLPTYHTKGKTSEKAIVILPGGCHAVDPSTDLRLSPLADVFGLVENPKVPFVHRRTRLIAEAAHSSSPTVCPYLQWPSFR